MNKKGFELAMSTLIIIILAMFLLSVILIAFTGAWKYFLNYINGYKENDVDKINKVCQNQCIMESKYGYCCENKTIGKELVTCKDKRIKIDCNIECEGVCNG